MSNSNDKQNPATLLTALLSGLATGNVKVIDLELDPNQPIEPQLEAAHREHCSACRAKYEIEQAKEKAAQTDRVAGKRPEFGAAYGAGEFNAELMKKAAEGESIKGTKPIFHEIGFMAFSGDTPIPQSFSTDRDVITKAFAEFRSNSLMKALDALTDGKATDHLSIRPVYDRRED